MAFSSLSLQKDATSGTTVGGTPMALSSDGVEVKNGIHVADMDEANFIIRTNMTCKTRNPQLLSDGSYSKSKRTVTIVVPDDLGADNGGVVFNLVRIEIEIHPKSTVSEAVNIHMLGAQVLTDSDLDNYRLNGSLL
jgi:hypothetical protein